MLSPTERFSSRVENYIKYRPSYPAQVLATLQTECGLMPAAVIADIGSGTGLLTELFLRNGNPVFGVEPNREMREAGERLLHGYPQFTSLAATAEATSLPDHTIDFVTAGQAFHWFDHPQARAEFFRILKPRGWVVLIWNDRRIGSTPFLHAYEQLLLQHSTDYETVNHQQVSNDSTIEDFYAPGVCQCLSFPNLQHFDFEGVKGRLLSSSYVPEIGHPNYEPMINTLQILFDTYQVDGKVTIEYDTQVYYGQLFGVAL